MSVRTQMISLLAEREQTPTAVKHCVAKVAPKYGGDTSRAFAICVAQLQKAGQLKPGSMKATSKGKKAHTGNGAKLKSYEKLLKKARK